MQDLAAVSSAGTSYTAAQVLARLFSPTPQKESWTFYRLNKAGIKYPVSVGSFDSVVDYSNPPIITHDSTRAVRRDLQIVMRGDAALTALSDLIQPAYRAYMPDGGFVEYPLGVFQILPPAKKITAAQTWLTLKLPDLSQLLVNASFLSSYAVPAGSTYVAAITGVVSSAQLQTPIQILIPENQRRLPFPIGWGPGTSRLQAINELLAAINYFPAWVDELGRLRSSPIPDWNLARPAATFDATGNLATLTGEINEAPDISRAFNQARCIGEDPRALTPVTGTYVNNNPESPVSTKKWGPVMGPVIQNSAVPDSITAGLVARAAVQAAARIYSEVTLRSLAWPASQDNDVYQVRYSSKDEGLVNFPYVEIGWVMNCAAGLVTEHTVTRLVPA